jgi:hypothetical protein
VEWTKARARAHRWKEEVKIVLKEQHQILETLEYTAQCWDARASSYTNPCPVQSEGAYALDQHHIFLGLWDEFESLWAFDINTSEPVDSKDQEVDESKDAENFSESDNETEDITVIARGAVWDRDSDEEDDEITDGIEDMLDSY